MKAKNVKMDSLSAINQTSLGTDSRADFVAAAQQLYPNVKVQTDLLPSTAGQYGTEISALVGAGSMWSIRACGAATAGLRPAICSPRVFEA